MIAADGRVLRGSASRLTVSPGPARSPRALTRLRSEGSSPEAIDQLLREHSIPLVEGPTCTFLWRGEADWVGVEHRMLGVPIPLPLRRLKGTDLWYASVELPPGARIQYRLLVRRGEHAESVNDPLNHRVVGDPIGSQSVLEADGYVTPDWTQPDPAAVQGEMVDLRLPEPGAEARCARDACTSRHACAGTAACPCWSCMTAAISSTSRPWRRCSTISCTAA